MKQIITLIMIGSIIMTSCEKQPDVAVISTKYGDMILELSLIHISEPTRPY